MIDVIIKYTSVTVMITTLSSAHMKTRKSTEAFTKLYEQRLSNNQLPQTLVCSDNQSYYQVTYLYKQDGIYLVNYN